MIGVDDGYDWRECDREFQRLITTAERFIREGNPRAARSSITGARRLLRDWKRALRRKGWDI